MLKYTKDQFSIHESVFIAPSADIIGKVTIGKNSSVWYQSVLRGDVDEIIIGDNSNIQDGSIIHCVNGFPAKLGDNSSLGHGVILHGCTVGNNVLVGMRATILTGAVIGNNCLIGAGALVSEGTVIPDNSLVLGIPAKIKAHISEKQLEIIRFTSDHYIEYAKEYLNRSSLQK